MSFTDPTSILHDRKGVQVAVSGTQVMATSPSGSDANVGFLMAGSGSDGIVRFFRADTDGALFITGSVTTAASNNDQGNQGTPDQSWYMVITDGTSSTALGSAENTPLWISGTVDTQGPDGTSVDPIYVTGSVGIDYNINPSATVTQVGAAGASTTLAASNTSRRGLTIFHDGRSDLYVKLGTAASLTSFSVKITARGYYEVPFNYTGEVTGIWDGNFTTDNAYVTEVTE